MENDEGKEGKEVIQDPNLDKYNVALQHLGEDISNAINKYLKNGYVNLAAIVGVLEDQKINVCDIVRRRIPEDRVKFKKLEPASYIG